MGRTRTNKIVVFEGKPEHVGQIFPINVTQANGFSLYGTPVMQTSSPAFA
jgi:tRNA-2-methylthio-N6-dimethylallyladenosine synthase